ncbi:hypothetical protein L3073_03545 [Ancylomarina sp. DW003]|nr:hypothetical protein [Ancylomarina sp. DW003]MDE5421271.1 hypothetical protein [Ancylomarina sp. DW003]
MNIITQNPFRVLGLTGNATERELQKQLAKIKAFERVGKTVSLDYDFNIIGQISRGAEDIQEASNKIEQAHKKLIYSLFWFVKNTQFDEIAFNNLKENDTEKAIEIWNKTLREEITAKNYSSYLNLSTLYIALSTIAEQIDLQKLQAGISLKGNLIHSESLKDFSKLVTGNGISNDPNEISKKFVDEVIELLKPYLNKRSGISANDLISFFSSYPSSIQKYIAAKFTEVPISTIENKIEKTTQKRKNNPRDAEEYGEELYKKTKSDITLLKKLMGSSNVQYQMLANKLANEILQCSIDFFNTLRDEGGEYDPGEAALKVAKYAKAIGTTGQTKSRIKENTEVMQEWVDDKPNRQRQEAIAEDLAFVTNKLQRFQNLSDSIDNSRNLIVSCKPKLNNVKNELGGYDDLYLQISSAVVSNALGMIIEVVNRGQSQLQHDRTKLITLPTTISSAVSVIEKMECFDMVSEVRNRFDTNKRTIKGIKSQLDSITNASRSYSATSSTNKASASNSNSNSSSGNSGAILFVIIVVVAIIIALLSNDNSKSYSDYRTSSNNHSAKPSYSFDKKNTEPVYVAPAISKYKGNKLKNGSSPYNAFFGAGVYNKKHHNWMTFKNGYQTDAIVCLVNYYSGKTIRNEYIQAGTTFKMTNLPNGTYYMKVFSGKDWNPTKVLANGKIKGGFDTNESFYQSKNSSDLLQLNDNGYQYSTGEITLYKVSSGNMQTQSMSETSFFN